MREYYNPFEDCMKGEKDSAESPFFSPYSIEPLWVLEATQLIIGVAYAYDTIKNNGGNITSLLTEIGKNLDEIRRNLERLTRQIDRVIDLLEDMPRIIRGELANGLIREALGQANQMVAVIQDRTRPDVMDQNVDLVDQLLVQLQVRLGPIIDHRGVSAVLCIAPYLPAWLAASVAVEKIRKKNNPAHIIQSPWDRSFLRINQQLFDDLYAKADDQDRDYNEKIIPSFPPHGKQLGLINGELVRDTNPNPSLGYYKINCPTNSRPERLVFCGREFGKPPHAWACYPTDEVEPVRAYQRFLDRRVEVVAFYEMLPKLHKLRANVMGSFVEPEGLWGID